MEIPGDIFDDNTFVVGNKHTVGKLLVNVFVGSFTKPTNNPSINACKIISKQDLNRTA